VAEGFEMHLDRLSDAVPKFHHAGDALAAALEALQTTLVDCTGMCGNDHQGKTFFHGYQRAAGKLDASAVEASHGLLMLGATVSTMVDNCQAMEHANTRMCHMPGGG
jgi:hypothetical protein